MKKTLHLITMLNFGNAWYTADFCKHFFKQVKQNNWVFSVSLPPPSLTDKIVITPPPPQLRLSWAAWFKFLFNEVIANNCLFILSSFSKQSASWKVLEIGELCALPTDSQKAYSVNTLVKVATASTGGGGNNPQGRDNPEGGRINAKDPNNFAKKN